MGASLGPQETCPVANKAIQGVTYRFIAGETADRRLWNRAVHGGPPSGGRRPWSTILVPRTVEKACNITEAVTRVPGVGTHHARY